MRRLIMLAVLVVAVALVLRIFVLGGDDTADDPPDLGDPALESIGLSSEVFRERYNRAMTLQVEGDLLRRPVWRPDPAVGMEAAEQALDGWGLIELLRDADEMVTAFVLTAQPTDDDQRRRLGAVAAAAMAAGLGIDVNEAIGVFNDELGSAEPGDRLQRRIEREGIKVELSLTDGTWLLEITVAG